MQAWLAAALCLPAGFAVAQASGIRPLGGIVLAALAAAAILLGRPAPARAAAWLAVLLACFVASHALADPLGTWGAVGAVTAVTATAAVVLLGNPRASSPTPDGR